MILNLWNWLCGNRKYLVWDNIIGYGDIVTLSPACVQAYKKAGFSLTRIR